jgi:hypothetical protein
MMHCPLGFCARMAAINAPNPGFDLSCQLPLQAIGLTATLRAMKYAFDMDDRSRLPWRFHGEALAILATL